MLSRATLPVRRPPTVDYRAMAEFRYQLRRFMRVSEDAARAAGLEPQQHQLLLAVKGVPSGQAPTIAWVAERLQLKHHSVVGLVDRLESRQLIARRRDPADHRRALLSLTPAAETILHRLSARLQQEIRTGARGLVSATLALAGRRHSA